MKALVWLYDGEASAARLASDMRVRRIDLRLGQFDRACDSS